MIFHTYILGVLRKYDTLNSLPPTQISFYIFNCLLGAFGKQRWLSFDRWHFQMHFLDINVCISINISLNLIPKGPIDNIPALVQIMTLCFMQPSVLQIYCALFSDENTHSSSIKVRYGCLLWVSSLTKGLPLKSLCCVQYCVILCCDISRAYSIMLYWTVLYGLYIYIVMLPWPYLDIYTYMTNDPCI